MKIETIKTRLRDLPITNVNRIVKLCTPERTENRESSVIRERELMRERRESEVWESKDGKKKKAVKIKIKLKSSL